MGVFGERVTLLLKKNNLTQRELAEKVGVAECVMSRYISGEREPKMEMISKISSALKTTADYLLGNETDEVFNLYKVKRMIARNSNNLTPMEKKELIEALFGEE